MGRTGSADWVGVGAMSNVVRFPKDFQMPAPTARQAAKERAHAEQLCERMTMWAVDAENNVGLTTARQMLLTTLHWVDMRMQYKGGHKQ